MYTQLSQKIPLGLASFHLQSWDKIQLKACIIADHLIFFFFGIMCQNQFVLDKVPGSNGQNTSRSFMLVTPLLSSSESFVFGLTVLDLRIASNHVKFIRLLTPIPGLRLMSLGVQSIKSIIKSLGDIIMDHTSCR